MATLKISDLSVGDWVQDKNGIYAKVIGVENWSNGYLLNIELHGVNVGSTPLASAHPIPITAEILESNGFERGRRGDFYHHLRLDKNRTLYIHASTNGWRVEITYDTAGILRTTHLMPDMNSVHELQHALRLAGIDKEINL